MRPMPASSRWTATMMALVVSAAPPIAGTETEGPPRLPAFDASISVDLVTLEVLVVDGRGRPVPDLTREEFRLFEDGNPVDITYFEPPSGAIPGSAAGDPTTPTPTGSPDPAVATPPEPPAHVIVFVDNLHVGVMNREATFDAIRETLQEDLGPRDEVMLVSYDGTVSVELPFTSSRRELASALEAESHTEARYLIAAMDDRRAMERIQRTAEIEAGTAKHPEVGVCASLGQFAWEYAWSRRTEVLQAIDALRGFVGTLAGVPGRKTLIHVSDGIPLTPGAPIVQYAIDFCDGTAAQEGIPHSLDLTSDPELANRYWNPAYSRIEMAGLDVSKDWYRLAAEASTYGVTFYPLQTSGITGIGTDIAGEVRATQKTEALARNDPRDTLVLLAKETGGRALLNANDLRPALSEALSDRRHAYVLGFSPVGAEDDFRHRLRVDVTRRDAQVHHSRSYYRKGPHQRMAETVISSLIHGFESNPLGLAVSPPRRSGSEASGALRVSVPLARTTMVPMGEVAEGNLTFFVVVRRNDGTISEVRRRTIPVRVPAELAKQDLPFAFDLGMDLAPGEHQVAVGVYDEIGGGLSYLRHDVRVESRAAGRP